MDDEGALCKTNSYKYSCLENSILSVCGHLLTDEWLRVKKLRLGRKIREDNE